MPALVSDPQIIGARAEQLAADFLRAKGLVLLCQNYRCRAGELDLILRDDEGLVVVEVRRRSNQRYGGAAASVTARKQQRLIAATHHYLADQAFLEPVRFDVVEVTGTGKTQRDIRWIQHAFTAEQ